jgi:hypothetical protein
MLRRCSSSKQAKRPRYRPRYYGALEPHVCWHEWHRRLDNLKGHCPCSAITFHNTMPCLKAIGSFVNELDI